MKNVLIPMIALVAALPLAAATPPAVGEKARDFQLATPDGKNVVDRIQPTGYIPNSGDWVVGENLAWGSGALSTPQAIVNGWMNSPGHRANILKPAFTHIGIGLAGGGRMGTYWTQLFGA